MIVVAPPYSGTFHVLCNSAGLMSLQTDGNASKYTYITFEKHLTTSQHPNTVLILKGKGIIIFTSGANDTVTAMVTQWNFCKVHDDHDCQYNPSFVFSSSTNTSVYSNNAQWPKLWNELTLNNTAFSLVFRQTENGNVISIYGLFVIIRWAQ